ncbi:MAG: SDR family oxidoreductase [Candidatus Eisenbacteria bacterium]
MAKYVITGGAGFIGSNIARKLIGLGEEVVILDDFSTGKRENLEDIKSKVNLVEGDICNVDVVEQAVKGADYVLHHAAVVSVPRSVEDPVRTNEVNVDGTLNCLLAARDAGVRRFVFAASSSAYGDSVELPKREDMRPDPLSPYGIAKLVGEMYCKVFFDVYGLETVSLRYFNIFGPYQDPASQYAAVVPIFITKLLEGESPIVYGDGEQSRDFTYIDNAVEANILATTSPRAPGKVINVACGTRFTLNDLFRRVSDLIGTKTPATYTEPRAGDILHSQGDISVASDLLGYSPRITFEAGLAKTVDWFRSR